MFSMISWRSGTTTVMGRNSACEVGLSGQVVGLKGTLLTLGDVAAHTQRHNSKQARRGNPCRLLALSDSGSSARPM